jgi:hypothetical protein
MSRLIWLVLLLGLVGSGLAYTPTDQSLVDARGTLLGAAEVETLGQVNGQALGCRYFRTSKTAKALMMRFVPKTRAYGALFESVTNAAFVAQTKEATPCPSEAALGMQLSELATALEQRFAGHGASSIATAAPGV